MCEIKKDDITPDYMKQKQDIPILNIDDEEQTQDADIQLYPQVLKVRRLTIRGRVDGK